VKRRLFLDIVVGQRSSILELFASENQALLIRGNALLVLDLRLDVIDSVTGLYIECDGLTREGFDEYLHGCSQLLILCFLPQPSTLFNGERSGLLWIIITLPSLPLSSLLDSQRRNCKKRCADLRDTLAIIAYRG
jgi:hypothetical protein